MVERAGFEPAKLYKSRARLNLIESCLSDSRRLSDNINTIKHGVTVRVFGHFTTSSIYYNSQAVHLTPFTTAAPGTPLSDTGLPNAQSAS